MDCHYKSFSQKDVRKFIEDVINGDDFLKMKREILISKYLKPPFGKSASENIMDVLINLISE